MGNGQQVRDETLDQTCLPGTAVTSHVELRERIGRGAMGELWRAWHHTLETDVAVKLLLPEYRDHPSVKQRLRVEAVAAARVRHPHVIQVHDHGYTVDGLGYIVMELFDGETLAAFLTRHPRPPIGWVMQMLEQLAGALEAAHRCGVVHRDVKPHNLALVDAGAMSHLKLFDFGVASVQGLTETLQLTKPGMLVGTPSYMSAEQIKQDRHIDHRSDLWSFGVIAYEMLTGRVPFDDRSVRIALAAVLCGRYEPPSALVPSLGPAVDAWFRRAVHEDPEQRFPAAERMCTALREALPDNLRGHAPVSGVRPGVRGDEARTSGGWSRRWHALWRREVVGRLTRMV